MSHPIPAIVQQQKPVELPVPMSESQQSAYQKWQYMENSFKQLQKMKNERKELKEVIEARRKEDEEWLHIQQNKKALLDDMAQERKAEIKVLSRLNKEMEKDMDTLDGLNARIKEREQLFSESAIECAKDPIQMRLVIFDDEGFICNSVCGFTAKIAKQKRPRKKSREGAYTKAKFISDTFEKKESKKEEQK